MSSRGSTLVLVTHPSLCAIETVGPRLQLVDLSDDGLSEFWEVTDVSLDTPILPTLHGYCLR